MTSSGSSVIAVLFDCYFSTPSNTSSNDVAATFYTVYENYNGVVTGCHMVTVLKREKRELAARISCDDWKYF